MLQYLHRLHPLLLRILPLQSASQQTHHRSSVLQSGSLPHVLLHIHSRHGLQGRLPLPVRSLPVQDSQMLQYLRRLHPLLPQTLPLLPASLLLHRRSSVLRYVPLPRVLLHIHSHRELQGLLPLPARSLPVPESQMLQYLRRLHPLLPRTLPLLPASLLLHRRSSVLRS